MSIIVQKYGGSSLADIEKIKKIAKKIAAKKEEGHSLAIVVSAMGKTTNNLIEMAKEVSPNPQKREMDMLLSTGERITMSLLCMALNDMGFDAVSLTGSQAGIITNDCHNDARVIEVRPFRVEDEMRRGKIVVVGGFQGVSYKRDVTTLGRSGSDTSAVALAAALGAEACEIYSDVDGVYSADPNIVNNAVHLPELSFQQMQEMGMAGARVLNAQAVEFAKNANIAIYARSTFGDECKETIIRKIPSGISKGIKSIVYEKEVVRVRVSGDLFKENIDWLISFLKNDSIVMKELNIIDDTAGTESKASFLLSHNNIYGWDKIHKKMKDRLQNNIQFDFELGAVSLIGEGINKDNTVLEGTLKLLRDKNISVRGITTTSFRLSLIIEKEKIDEAVRLCHERWITGS